MASEPTPQLPAPNLSEDDLRALLVRSMGIVGGQPQSDTTKLIADLLEIIVAQSLEINRLTQAPVVSNHLLAAFNEGVEQARQ